ncbi:MAG TPA: hypothetical protein VHL09_00440 [Dehalococcoidia bacterium]|nr:hypothetical protein [Dehalococcoidia bacterium]
MPQPRSKVSLSAGDRSLLLEALRASRDDPAGFPVESDRRERLERWIERFEERAGAGPVEVRVAPSDWDVLQTSLGWLIRDLRAQCNRHFDVLQAGLVRPDTVAPDHLTAAQRDLGRLEQATVLLEHLRSRLVNEQERAARRRRILP